MFKNLLLIASMVLLPILSAAKVNVVASISDLAYFAREIGGDYVNVETIAAPKSDPHFVEVRPSYMVKVKKADMVLKVGMELDMWMDQIIDGSRHGHLEIVDCSEHINRLEVPSYKVDARYGDIHRFGNPHYWLDPDNAEPIAESVRDGLLSVDPDHAEVFRQNYEQLVEKIRADIKELGIQAASLKGEEIIFYHNSWPYFSKFTGVKEAGFIEPYPGVAPSPGHIKEIIDLVKARGIKTIAIEPYFDKRVPDKIAASTGAKVVVLYPSIGGRDANESYMDWLGYNINALKEN